MMLASAKETSSVPLKEDKKTQVCHNFIEPISLAQTPHPLLDCRQACWDGYFSISQSLRPDSQPRDWRSRWAVCR